MCGRLRCAYFVTHVVQPNSPYVWPLNSASRYRGAHLLTVIPIRHGALSISVLFTFVGDIEGVSFTFDCPPADFCIFQCWPWGLTVALDLFASRSIHSGNAMLGICPRHQL